MFLMRLSRRLLPKIYDTGTVWGPPLWIPYSSMLIGAVHYDHDTSIYGRTN